jgi:tetratricopeptide (TPR) repeat protein
VSDHSSVFRLLALATLLAAFAVSARGGVGGSGAGSQSAAACELDPPRDAAALERCVAISPRDIELMLDLGAIYEADGRGDRAEALYRLALSIDAKDADVHVRLGRLLLGRGDARASAHEAAKALELQPGSSRALKLLQHAERGGTR